MPDPVAFSTLAAHAGRGAPPRSVSRPLTPPIYQSTVYAFDRLEDLEAMNGSQDGMTAFGRHRGSANFTFCDGHVSYLKKNAAQFPNPSGDPRFEP